MKTNYLRYPHFFKEGHIYKLYDNGPKTESITPRHQNGQHIFEVIKTYITFGDNMMGGKMINIGTLPSLAYLSRSSPYALRICHIAQAWRSPSHQ